jgi:PAS domain S-box-containing protein
MSHMSDVIVHLPVREESRQFGFDAALRSADARFRACIENLPVAMFVVDVTGKVLESNPATRTLFGYDCAAVNGRHVGVLHRPEDLPGVLDDLAALQRDGRTQWECQMLRAGGATFWAAVSSVRLPDGRSLRFVQDIDLRKQAEALAMQRQRLTLLGEVAAGLAHELRQPLMVISLAAENATASLLLDHDICAATDQLRDVVAQANRAREIINRVHMFGCTDTAPAMPTRIADAVDGALTVVRSRLQEHRIVVSQTIPGDLPEVNLARVPFEQILTNLILNACDAYAGCRTAERTIAITVRQDDAHVVLTVADQAGGIPGSALPFVFEPFFTTKPAGHGAGLGLSISSKIATDAGGSLTARNQGRGAVFECLLPVRTTVAAAA